jgi:flagellum-specific peptidoglycan hydrolase FlgJ
LATASPYQTATTFLQDPDRFADALTGVYATDPQYGETPSWVMENYQLKAHESPVSRR